MAEPARHITQPRLRFAAPLYPGGRHCLLCGSVTVGAVFPPPRPDGTWHWHLFQLGANPMRDGTAKTEARAREALMGAFRTWLAQAELEPPT